MYTYTQYNFVTACQGILTNMTKTRYQTHGGIILNIGILNKTKMKSKLIISFSILLIFIIGIGTFSIIEIGSLNSEVDNLTLVNAKQIEDVTQISERVKDNSILIHSLLIGEQVQSTDFTTIWDVIQIDLSDLATLTIGTEVENNITDVQTELSNLKNLITETNNGLVDTINLKTLDQENLDTSVTQFDDKHSEVTQLFSLIESQMNQFAQQMTQPICSTNDSLLMIKMVFLVENQQNGKFSITFLNLATLL